MSKKWGAGPVCPACKKSVYPLEEVFAADRKRFHRDCLRCKAKGCRHQTGGGEGGRLQVVIFSSSLTEKDIHKHQDGYNICSKCYDSLYRPRVRPSSGAILQRTLTDSLQEFLAEGEETPSERRARLAREAEERDRRRQAGEEERLRLELEEKEEFNFSFLKVAEIVGIAPESSICL